jgi:hypothetical protein
MPFGAEVKRLLLSFGYARSLTFVAPRDISRRHRAGVFFCQTWIAFDENRKATLLRARKINPVKLAEIVAGWVAIAIARNAVIIVIRNAREPLKTHPLLIKAAILRHLIN